MEPTPLTRHPALAYACSPTREITRQLGPIEAGPRIMIVNVALTWRLRRSRGRAPPQGRSPPRRRGVQNRPPTRP